MPLNDKRVKLDLSLTKRFNFKFKLRDSVWIIHHVLNILTRKSTWILIKNVTFSIYKNLTLLCWNIKNYKKTKFSWRMLEIYFRLFSILFSLSSCGPQTRAQLKSIGSCHGLCINRMPGFLWSGEKVRFFMNSPLLSHRHRQQKKQPFLLDT